MAGELSLEEMLAHSAKLERVAMGVFSYIIAADNERYRREEREKLKQYSPLNNDKERIRFAMVYINEHDRDRRLLGHDEKPKAAEFAKVLIDEGNELFLHSRKHALLFYTRGIVYAVPNSPELARGYANRSAVLCELGLYNDCLIDIDRALARGYPDNMKAKLYARQAKSLLALNESMCPKVEEAIVQARQKMEKMDDIQKKRIIDILNNLKPDSLKKPNIKPDLAKLMPETPGGNPKILQASDSIELNYSQDIGLQIEASRDIEIGETLMVHRAYAAIPKHQLDDTSCIVYEYCWNCLKKVSAGEPCDKCINVIYCSEKCREAAWQDHHDIECAVVKAMVAKETYNDHKQLALRLTVKAIKEAGTLDALKEKLDKIDSMIDPTSKYFDGDAIDGTKYASLYGLTEEFPNKSAKDSYDDSASAAQILIYLAATTELFGEKLTEFTEILNHRWTDFMGLFILRNVRISKSKSLGVIVDCENKIKAKPQALVVIPALSLFSRSPEPAMTCLYTAGAMSALIAVKTIKKGKRISYGDIKYAADRVPPTN